MLSGEVGWPDYDGDYCGDFSGDFCCDFAACKQLAIPLLVYTGNLKSQRNRA